MSQSEKVLMSGKSSGQFCAPNGGIGALRGGRELVAGVANVVDQCLDSLPKTSRSSTARKPGNPQNSAVATSANSQKAQTSGATSHNPMFFPTSGSYDQTGSVNRGYSSTVQNAGIPNARIYGSSGQAVGAHSTGRFCNSDPYKIGRYSGMLHAPPANLAAHFGNGYHPGAFSARTYGHSAHRPVPANPCAYNMASYNPGQVYNPAPSFGFGGTFNR